jgi:hypothetical protein
MRQCFTGLVSDAASQEISIENTDEGSKAVSVNSKMLGSQSFGDPCYSKVSVKTQNNNTLFNFQYQC